MRRAITASSAMRPTPAPAATRASGSNRAILTRIVIACATPPAPSRSAPAIPRLRPTRARRCSISGPPRPRRPTSVFASTVRPTRAGWAARSAIASKPPPAPSTPTAPPGPGDDPGRRHPCRCVPQSRRPAVHRRRRASLACRGSGVWSPRRRARARRAASAPVARRRRPARASHPAHRYRRTAAEGAPERRAPKWRRSDVASVTAC